MLRPAERVSSLFPVVSGDAFVLKSGGRVRPLHLVLDLYPSKRPSTPLSMSKVFASYPMRNYFIGAR